MSRRTAAARVGLALLALQPAVGACTPGPAPEPVQVTITTEPDDPSETTPAVESAATITLAVDGTPVEESWLDRALCSVSDDRVAFAAAADAASITGEIVTAGAPHLRAVAYTTGSTTYTSDLTDPGDLTVDGDQYVIESVVTRSGEDETTALSLTVRCDA